MQELGRHYIAELWECPSDLLDDKERLRQLALEAASAANVTVLNSQFHHFSPQGVTGLLLLAESHLSLHSWPEYGYCAVDLFTCGDFRAGRRAVKELAKKLQAGQVVLSELKRGILESTPVPAPHFEVISSLLVSSHGGDR